MQKDYDAILELQKTRYIHNLDRQERRKGFLSVQMTRDEIDRFASDLGIALAFDSTALLGFFCLSRVRHWMNNPIISALVAALQESFAGNNVAEPALETCLFGPVCLSDKARGKNVFQQLHAFTCQAAAREFDFAISFISASNLPSITAARGVDTHPVGQFFVGERRYYSYFISLQQYSPASSRVYLERWRKQA